MTLHRRYPSAAFARRMAAALEADQPAHVQWVVRGSSIQFRFTGATPESARATGDDLLACLTAAEKTAELPAVRRSSQSR